MMTHTALVAVLNKTLVSALNSRLERKDHGGKYFKMFSSSKQVKIKRELMKITVIVFFFSSNTWLSEEVGTGTFRFFTGGCVWKVSRGHSNKNTNLSDQDALT